MSNRRRTSSIREALPVTECAAHTLSHVSLAVMVSGSVCMRLASVTERTIAERALQSFLYQALYAASFVAGGVDISMWSTHRSLSMSIARILTFHALKLSLSSLPSIRANTSVWTR